MPTVLDAPRADERATIPVLPKPLPATTRVPAARARTPQRELFSDSLLDSGAPERRRRGLATTFSFALECVLLGFLLALPLMFTEALPTQQFLTFLAAPPPPPPPPPPAAAPIVKVVQTNILDNGQLRTPTRIPRKVEIIREEEAPPPAYSGGVIGGVPGGVPGGQLGGVIGGIISSANSTAIVPKVQLAKRVRVSQGVTQGLLITKIEPAYPKIALAARIRGVVLLKAVIDKQGDIKELEVIQGHPMLAPAAIDAVKQWRYRPYLLSGEPVEVETTITVTFQISD